ncbi:hypothetical protein AQUCO_02700071v1 [Aquilegia coerulea]|uniref:RBR-type E3 ubiquitin transferase n=1 Tax=Aquilegia coerulea TaxID=218851 RepID=A0A2G5D522_AQUCA|nr:hypothetical protein AQUCO_02700071v1 [Aquilegia coerulea]
MDFEEDDHVSDDYYSDDDNVYDDDDLTDTTTMKDQKEKKYTVLSEYDIIQRQEDYITEISNVLCVSRAEASLLLREHNWSVSKVHESWFSNEEQVCYMVGLLENTSITQNDGNSNMACKICYTQFGCDEKVHHDDAGCGSHSCCSLCWKDYITNSIVNDGAGCLNLRCPDPSCSVPVDQDLIKKVVSAKDNVTYLHYLVRSYVEGNHNIKFCPVASCDYAVEYKYKVSCRGNFDVTCMCTHSFCWKCMEEAHSPVDCDIAANWSDETKSLNWILDNCKPCPKCKEQIQPDTNLTFRMTCICGFEFCWSCLSPWIGWRHTCNNDLDEDEKIRNITESMLDRYTHHYGKWKDNESLRQKAKENLQKFQAMEKLKNGQGIITEAMELIIECRRVLKWTYAYKYYLPEGETKSQLFEYLQSEAESSLERLQHCAEMELEMQLYGDGYGLDFNLFCEKLSNLINFTQDLFMNLVQELENGHLVEGSRVVTAPIEV